MRMLTNFIYKHRSYELFESAHHALSLSPLLAFFFKKKREKYFINLTLFIHNLSNLPLSHWTLTTPLPAGVRGCLLLQLWEQP